MVIRCPSCQCEIAKENTNIAADLAKCASCHEVFAISTVVNQSRAASGLGRRPGAIVSPPHDTKVVITDLGTSKEIRIPPMGFHFAQLFLMAFAVTWWSFLLTFVGVGSFLGNEDNQVAATQPATTPTMDEVGPTAGHQPDSEHEDASLGGFPRKFMIIFLALFLTPFFMAGFFLLGSIFWPLFGRTRIQLSGMECSYRSSLFGLGWTRRAPTEDTFVEWSEQGHAVKPGCFRTAGTFEHSNAYLGLTLGRKEKIIGGHLSRREQEWLFQEMDTYLAPYHR